MSKFFSSRDGMSRVRLYFFMTGGAQGIYLPFVNVYFEQQLGLSGQEISWLAAVAPIMTLLVAPFWGAVADARGSRLNTLRWALAGTAVGAMLVAWPQSFVLLLPAVAVYTLFQVAVIPLGNGLIAGAAAERGVNYGDLRLWASLGFAVSGVGFGQLVSRVGLRSLFPVYAALFVLALVASRHMVRREPASPPADSGLVIDLLRDKQLARFMVVAGLAAIGITVGYMFVYVFLIALGASAGLSGVVSAVGALAEVPAMRYSGKLIRKWGAPSVFAAGVLLFGLGWFFYATLHQPTLAPLIQVLNGVGMGLLWPAGVTYVAGRTPTERGATAQSLFNAVMYGAAPLTASLFTGTLFDLTGARVVLLVAAAFMAASVLLFVFLRRLSPAKLDSMSAP